MLLSTLQLLVGASLAFVQNWTGDPFIRPAAPLAVKGPFLQTWMPLKGASGFIGPEWQTFRGDSVGPPITYQVPRELLSTDQYLHSARNLHGLGCSG